MTTTRHALHWMLAVCASLTLAACSHKAVESVATEEDVPVVVKPVQTVDTFETTISATGVVTPESGADWTITAPEAARIAELPKAEGDAVNVGDLLVRFEIPTMTADVTAKQADVAQAGAKVDAAKAALARVTGLVDRGIAARKEQEAATLDLAQAQAGLQQAQAALDSSKLLVDRTTVKARFPGIVAKRSHAVGDLVDAGGTVIRVIDPSRLEVETAVPVADLARIALGRSAHIESGASATAEAGTVVSAPAAVDPASATADVRVRFNAKTRLAAGVPVTVSIVAERLTKVLVVPTVAIIHDGDEIFVMVAGQDDDKAHKTPVTIGPASGGNTQVKTGLKAGDLVIVRGQDGLPDEASITIIK